MKNILLLGLSLIILTLGCKPATTSETVEAPVSTAKYTLTPFTASPEFSDAKIESINYKDGKFAIGIDSETYTLGTQTVDATSKMCANSAKGQHIHLIVDNAPYAAKYTADFEHEVADGEHYTLAFLSRSYHESIKTSDAHQLFLGTYKDNTLVSEKEVTQPILSYSRPKGTYVGKANTDKVMLDFYLSNVTLENHKVIANVNGEDHTVDTWQPYYIEGLPIGDNTITLTLVDGEGKKVDTPMNPVSRTFKLEADPTEQ